MSEEKEEKQKILIILQIPKGLQMLEIDKKKFTEDELTFMKEMNGGEFVIKKGDQIGPMKIVRKLWQKLENMLHFNIKNTRSRSGIEVTYAGIYNMKFIFISDVLFESGYESFCE